MRTLKYIFYLSRYALAVSCAVICVSCSPSAHYPPEIRLLISELKKNPGNPKQYENLINALYAYQYYDAGLEYARKLLSLDPHSAFGLFSAGLCCEKRGFWDTAEEYFKKAREGTTPNKNAYLHLAALYYGKGAYKKCVETVQQLLSLGPESSAVPVDALILSAKASYYDGDRGTAYKIIDQIMQFNFNNKDALYQYALWKVRDAKYQEAIPALAKYISLFPTDPAAYILLGTAYYHDGKLAYAEKAFLKASGTDPSLKVLAEIVHIQNTESTYNLINTAVVKTIEEYGFRDGDTYYVRGIVENLGLEVAKEVSVVIQIVDKKNALIGQKLFKTSPRNLRPKQYAFFHAEFPYSQDIAGAIIRPNWEKRSTRMTLE